MKTVTSVQSLSVNFLALEHVDALEKSTADPSFAALMGVAFPISSGDVPRYVEGEIAGRTEGRTHVSVIKNRNDVVGLCGLYGLNSGEAPELSSWIAPEFRGRGYATFGVKMTLQLAFKNLGLTRVRTVTFEAEAAARQVALKNGFQFLFVQPCRDSVSKRPNELQAVYEITWTQWIDFSNAPALARLHPALKQMLQAELAAGNELLEAGGGWPDAESVFVKLRYRFRARHEPLPAGVVYTEPKSPQWWIADYSTASPAHILACGEA